MFAYFYGETQHNKNEENSGEKYTQGNIDEMLDKTSKHDSLQAHDSKW